MCRLMTAMKISGFNRTNLRSERGNFTGFQSVGTDALLCVKPPLKSLQVRLVTVAELFLVGSAGKTGKAAIAKGGKTGQNYFRVFRSVICAGRCVKKSG